VYCQKPTIHEYSFFAGQHEIRFLKQRNHGILAVCYMKIKANQGNISKTPIKCGTVLTASVYRDFEAWA